MTGGVAPPFRGPRSSAREVRAGRWLGASNALGPLCLTQCRELRSRLNGLAHQLAERALLRAAGGRRGEHVFGRLRMGSDGTRTLRRSVRRTSRIWLWSAQSRGRFLQPILHEGERGPDPVGWPWRPLPRPERGPDVNLGADLVDDRVGELGRGRVAA